MDLFGKKDKKPKLSIKLHKDPAALTPNEGAVYLLLAGALADVAKLGVDPTTVHLSLHFKSTKHEMCLNLDHGTGISRDFCNN